MKTLTLTVSIVIQVPDTFKGGDDITLGFDRTKIGIFQHDGTARVKDASVVSYETTQVAENESAA